MQDNTSHLNAIEYDSKIADTIPFYQEFHQQTISVVRNMGFEKIDWLDLGCGTGTLAAKASQAIRDIRFTMVDPSENMLQQAKENNPDLQAVYLCAGSENITFSEEFDVITAIQSHHYLQKEGREKATNNVYRALRKNGIYIAFENVVPEAEELKNLELQRWGSYQKEHGKTDEEVKDHIARCGVNYFPLPVSAHIELLQRAGFSSVHVFWYSYMQMGIYAIK